MLNDGICEASLSPMLNKYRFNTSAIAGDSVIGCSLILFSEIFFTLFGCRENNLLIKRHFF